MAEDGVMESRGRLGRRKQERRRQGRRRQGHKEKALLARQMGEDYRKVV